MTRERPLQLVAVRNGACRVTEFGTQRLLFGAIKAKLVGQGNYGLSWSRLSGMNRQTVMEWWLRHIQMQLN